MSECSNRQQILEAIRDRLCAIRRSGGFQTDAGQLVFLGESPTLGDSDPDAVIAIVVKDDDVKWTKEHAFIELPVGVQAIAKPTLATPWSVVEAVIADIKKAMELEDRTFGKLLRTRIERGSTRTLAREDGTLVVGAEVEYLLPYAEPWGNP